MQKIILLPVNKNLKKNFSPYICKTLESVCIICGVVLLVIWPLPGTIALRNAALGLGFFAGVLWIYIVRPKISRLAFVALFSLFLVPIWLWLHLYIWPTDIVAQKYDLTGTWLRVILGMGMSAGLGLIISRRPKLFGWIFGAMCVVPLINFGMSAIEIFSNQFEMIGKFHAPYKYKSAAVYFIAWPCLIAYSIAHLQMQCLKINPKECRLFLISTMVLIICWIDILLVRSLNGVIIAGGFGLLWACILAYIQFVKNSKVKKELRLITIVSISALVVILASYCFNDAKNEKKLLYLLEDIKVGIQIDKFDAWKWEPKYFDANGIRNAKAEYERTPTDSKGRIVNASTYERAAWFIKGIELLNENYLGAGFTHLAFRYFMHQENPSLALYKTHSGWLDYALGVGIPGILLTWAAIFILLFESIKKTAASNYRYANTAIWTFSGIWLLWWTTELSEREFIEHLFFMTTFFMMVLQEKIRDKTL